jgi:hypothetical protein
VVKHILQRTLELGYARWGQLRCARSGPLHGKLLAPFGPARSRGGPQACVDERNDRDVFTNRRER